MIMDREEFERLRKLHATPIDFGQLVLEGVLRRHGMRWEVLDWNRLPKHAQLQVKFPLKMESDGALKYVSFRKNSIAAR